MKKIFIYGSSHFIDKNIAQETPKNSDADIEIYFGDELNKADFFSFTNTVSLFGNDKYAILRNVAKTSDIDNFIQNLSKISETSLIITSESAGGKSEDKLVKSFKSAGFEVREEGSFAKASNSDVLKIFKEKGIPVSMVNASYILNVSGGDMTTVESEAEKLAIYLSSNKNMTADDVVKHVSGEKEEKIYMAVSYFAQKNTKACLEIFKAVSGTSENNMFLFFSMAKFINNLYYSYIDASLSDAKTQFQRNLQENKRLWSRDEVAELLGYMAGLDFAIKTGRRSFENAIEDIIIKTSALKK